MPLVIPFDDSMPEERSDDWWLAQCGHGLWGGYGHATYFRKQPLKIKSYPSWGGRRVDSHALSKWKYVTHPR